MNHRQPLSTSNDRQIFFVGPRYQHHSKHSGYEGFVRYCGTHLNSPVSNRFLSKKLGYHPWIGDIGWQLDQAITKLVQRPFYSVGIFLIEMATGFHMMFHKDKIYHVLYGDTDVCFLGKFKEASKNFLVASFHEPPFGLEWFQIDKITSYLDGVILVSEYQRSYFEKFLPLERIFVVPHGVDTEFFKPASKLSEQPICITVGSHLRDFETFKAAIDIILKKNPSVRFIGVGTRTKGGNNSQLDDERVEFLENLSDEDLHQMYQMSKIALFSFSNATANNALLEAMSCGLPVVATDIGGIGEYVSDESALLCPPSNAEAIASAVLCLLDNQTLAQQMGTASRLQALNFDYQVVAEKMIEAYLKIIKTTEVSKYSAARR